MRGGAPGDNEASDSSDRDGEGSRDGEGDVVMTDK